VEYILTYVRTRGNTDALGACLYALRMQKIPDNVRILVTTNKEDSQRYTHVDYVAILDETHIPRRDWIIAMYEAAKAGAGVVHGVFVYRPPWSVTPIRMLDPLTPCESNRFARVEPSIDHTCVVSREAAVLQIVPWASLTRRQTLALGWRLGRSQRGKVWNARLAQLAGAIADLGRFGPSKRELGQLGDAAGRLFPKK